MYKIEEDEHTKTIYCEKYKDKKSKESVPLTNNVIVDFDDEDNIIFVEVIK